MRELHRAYKSWKIDNEAEKVEPKKKEESQPVIKITATPTLIPCTFSQNGFCRTQKEIGKPALCGVKKDSFAHQVCNKIQRGE